MRADSSGMAAIAAVMELFGPGDHLIADAAGYSQLGAPGLTACKAAYQHGEEWYEAVRNYICGNLKFMDTFLKENIPQLKMIRPEATYLACPRVTLTEALTRLAAAFA